MSSRKFVVPCTTYEIVVGDGLLDELSSELSQNVPARYQTCFSRYEYSMSCKTYSKYAVVTDENVMRILGNRIKNSLEAIKDKAAFPFRAITNIRAHHPIRLFVPPFFDFSFSSQSRFTISPFPRERQPRRDPPKSASRTGCLGWSLTATRAWSPSGEALWATWQALWLPHLCEAFVSFRF